MLIGVRIENFALLEHFTFGLVREDLIDPPPAKAEGEPLAERCFSLGRMAVIIGRNNSGKTLLFEALDFLGDCLRHSVPFAATRHGRGGFSRLHTYGSQANMRFELLVLPEWKDEVLFYRIEMAQDAHGRPYVLREAVSSLPCTETVLCCVRGARRGAEPAEERERLLLEIERGKGRIFAGRDWEEVELGDLKSSALSSFGRILKYRELRALYRFITGIFFLRDSRGLPRPSDNGRGSSQEGGHRHIDAYASNVRNVLAYLRQEDPKGYRERLKRIEKRIPSSQRLGDLVLDQGISSGEAKLFIILLLLQDPKPRPLVLLENPDSSLYHEMVEELANAFRDYVLRPEELQLFYSTHSSILLEALTPREVWVLSRPLPAQRPSYLQIVEASAPVSRSAARPEADARAGGQSSPEEREPLSLVARPEESGREGDDGTAQAAARPFGAPAASGAEGAGEAGPEPQGGAQARCVAASETVRAMYREGVGLGALWYAGHFDDELR